MKREIKIIIFKKDIMVRSPAQLIYHLISEESIDANFKNGILIVKIPKKNK